MLASGQPGASIAALPMRSRFIPVRPIALPQFGGNVDKTLVKEGHKTCEEYGLQPSAFAFAACRRRSIARTIGSSMPAGDLFASEACFHLRYAGQWMGCWMDARADRQMVGGAGVSLI